MKNRFIPIILIAIFLSGCTQFGNNNSHNIESYVACGCACCPDIDPEEKCIYHSKGDDLNKIIEEDKKLAQSSICEKRLACSSPIKYIYCD
ncbi:MAG: hypothetical protein KAI55_04940 [Candidatus Aenigmarchaeota archaeon]|nr:hypothetical protein [Candidatus Aenigmarchaeota archaeon]